MFAVLGGEDSLRSELDSVEYYNIEDDEWSEGPPMQEARFHPCAVFDKRIGNLMVLGGAGGSIATNTVEVHVGRTLSVVAFALIFSGLQALVGATEWGWAADMNDARQGAACATLGDYVYVCGGRCSSTESMLLCF